MKFGLRSTDNPFDALGCPTKCTPSKRREALLAFHWWTPNRDPDTYPREALDLYRKAMHAFSILSDEGLYADASAAAEAQMGIGGVIQDRAYPRVDQGEQDLDWMVLHLLQSTQEAARDRTDATPPGAALLEQARQHFKGLPKMIPGWRTLGIPQLDVFSFIREALLYHEIVDLKLPSGRWAYQITWRTSKWEKNDRFVSVNTKALNAQSQATYAGPGRAPLWDITISMPLWLVSDAEERLSLVHSVLSQLKVTRGGQRSDKTYDMKPGTMPEDLKAPAKTLARFGARTFSEAQMIAAAFSNPHTQLLVKLARELKLENPYDVAEHDAGAGEQAVFPSMGGEEGDDLDPDIYEGAPFDDAFGSDEARP